VEMIIENLVANSGNAKTLIKKLVPILGRESSCKCQTSMKYAIMTDPKKRNPETVKKLKTILPEYF